MQSHLGSAAKHRSLQAGPDLTLASRYECKYFIAPEQAPALRQLIAPFMEPDPYAQMHADLRYPICSLYIDSEDLALYQQTVNGEKNRFKLRVRTYSDDPSTPAFFEVKRKINNIVSKDRAAVPRSAIATLLQYSGGSQEIVRLPNTEFFDVHRSLIGAKPVAKVRYMREAYQCRTGDPVRITLDTELAFCPAFDLDLSHEQGDWFYPHMEGIIVEIKYTELCPAWVHDIVRLFDMKQRPVPKYVMSIDHMFESGRGAAINLAGVLLPPRRY